MHTAYTHTYTSHTCSAFHCTLFHFVTLHHIRVRMLNISEHPHKNGKIFDHSTFYLPQNHLMTRFPQSLQQHFATGCRAPWSVFTFKVEVWCRRPGMLLCAKASNLGQKLRKPLENHGKLWEKWTVCVGKRGQDIPLYDWVRSGLVWVCCCFGQNWKWICIYLHLRELGQIVSCS